MTLLETTLSLALLTSALLGLLMVVGQAVGLNAGTTVRTAAAGEVRRVTELVRGTAYADILTRFPPEATDTEPVQYVAEASMTASAEELLHLQGRDPNVVRIIYLTEAQAAATLGLEGLDCDGDGSTTDVAPASSWDALPVRVEVRWTEGGADGAARTETFGVETIVYPVME